MSRDRNPIEPAVVVQEVDEFVRSELSDARKYDNRSPLDESGVYSLHLLAASIYAKGHDDGRRSAEERNRGVDARRRDQEHHERTQQKETP